VGGGYQNTAGTYYDTLTARTDAIVCWLQILHLSASLITSFSKLFAMDNGFYSTAIIIRPEEFI